MSARGESAGKPWKYRLFSKAVNTFCVKLSTIHRKVRGARSLRTDASLTAGTNLAIAAMSFCTGIAAARMLGPHQRGELAAIQNTPSIIASFGMIGMAEALVYFSAQRPVQAGRYLGTAIGLALSASLPCLVVAWIAMPILIHAQTGSVIADARWYLLIAPVYATAGMLLHPLRGTGKFGTWNLLRLCVPILALCVLLLACVVHRMTPAFIAFANLTTYGILVLPFAWIIRRRIPGPYRPESEKIAPMLRYGFPCLMTGLPQTLNLRLDQLLMSAFLPPSDLGLYVVAVAWSGAVSPLLTSIGSTLLPAVASSNDRTCAIRRMSEGVKMTTMLAILMCAATAASAPFAIPLLFGAAFRGSAVAALILVPAGGVLGINFSLQEGIRGLGRPYLVLRAELFGLLVTAMSLAIMLRPFGIIGAAVASLLGYSTVTIAMLAGAKQLAGGSIASLIVPSPSEFRSGARRIAAFAKEIAA
jgi:O-antigen/teichoic acid export membrane protein